jgi:drug/metabolite transporter (DMT)-like permease
MVVMFDLSYITPLCTGIVQILTLIASKIIFKENISIQGIIGASIIIIGLLIMNWKK